MTNAVYVIEQPDHVCSIRSFSLEREEEAIKAAFLRGALWSERLGTVCVGALDEDRLIRRSTRQMVPLCHHQNDSKYFVALDYAEKLLKTPVCECTWMAQREYGSRVFLRFGSDLPEFVVRFFEHDPFDRPRVTLPLYIQETMIHPICTLSVNDGDLTYADCDWREILGTVEAQVVAEGIVDVPLEEVNTLIMICSRPMMLMSEYCPPAYISKEYLAVEAVKCRNVQHMLQTKQSEAQ